MMYHPTKDNYNEVYNSRITYYWHEWKKKRAEQASQSANATALEAFMNSNTFWLDKYATNAADSAFRSNMYSKQEEREDWILFFKELQYNLYEQLDVFMNAASSGGLNVICQIPSFVAPLSSAKRVSPSSSSPKPTVRTPKDSPTTPTCTLDWDAPAKERWTHLMKELCTHFRSFYVPYSVVQSVPPTSRTFFLDVVTSKGSE